MNEIHVFASRASQQQLKAPTLMHIIMTSLESKSTNISKELLFADEVLHTLWIDVMSDYKTTCSDSALSCINKIS